MPQAQAYEIIQYRDGVFSREKDPVVKERRAEIFVNNQLYVSVMATPEQLEALAVGYLFTEGAIQSVSEITDISVDGLRVGVKLLHELPPAPLRARSSGFGLGSVAVRDLAGEDLKPAADPPGIPAERIVALMEEFNQRSALFRQTGAVHSALLVTGEQQHFSEDVGRHNALDKVIGQYLRPGDSAGHGGLLFTTGRVSTEMVLKTARAGMAALISRGSASRLAVDLSEKLNLLLIGFARGQQFKAFCGGRHLEPTAAAPAKERRVRHYHNGTFTWEEAPLADECRVDIVVNGRRRASVMASPFQLDSLAVGFLFGEGLISGVGDIRSLRVNGLEIAVELNAAAAALSATWETNLPPIALPTLDAAAIIRLSDEFNASSQLFRQTGAVHSCRLIDGPTYHHADDVARHNALDKVIGSYLSAGPSGAAAVLLTTGRISTEILIKSAKAGIGAIISRGAPTDRAIELAAKLNLILIGFARHNRFNVYSGSV